jgi:hypothetical protein
MEIGRVVDDLKVKRLGHPAILPASAGYLASI